MIFRVASISCVTFNPIPHRVRWSLHSREGGGGNLNHMFFNDFSGDYKGINLAISILILLKVTLVTIQKKI